MKERLLTIENIQNIIGTKYSDWLDVIGVKEHRLKYEFTLGSNINNQIETIFLYRRRADNGMYVIEYNHKTMWLNRNEFDTIDKMIVCMQTI